MTLYASKTFNYSVVTQYFRAAWTFQPDSPIHLNISSTLTLKPFIILDSTVPLSFATAHLT